MTDTNRKEIVEICEDAISLIETEQLIADVGHFFEAPELAELRNRVIEMKGQDQDLRDLLPNIKEPCKVCALGACFVAVVRKHDDFQVSRLAYNGGAHGEDTIRTIQKVFPLELIKKIEVAFEHGKGWFTVSSSGEACDCEMCRNGREIGGDEHDMLAPYASSCADIFDNHDRLLAILNNIVVNNGDLVLPIERYVPKPSPLVP